MSGAHRIVYESQVYKTPGLLLFIKICCRVEKREHAFEKGFFLKYFWVSGGYQLCLKKFLWVI